MKKIIPVDPSKFSFTISRDLSITAVEQKPGPPVRMDGMTVGIVTMEHDAPHGGEVHPDGDEVLYVISGGVSVTSDSNPGETLELGPEDRANSRAFYSKGGLSATLNPSGGWELGQSRRQIRKKTCVLVATNRQVTGDCLATAL